MRISIVSAISLTFLSGCTQKPQAVDPQTVIDAIRGAEASQAAALGRKDLEGAYAVFTEDSRLYMTGMPPAIGREAIKAVNERALKDPAFNAKIDEASRKWWISKSGDLATTTYTTVWTHTDATSGKPVTEPLTSQTTWAKQTDGAWKNVMDIDAVFEVPTATSGKS
jgi:ketosteroid isomerase-like protein